MSNVKDNSYISFYGWMRNRLGLKGTQLMVYAVVYSFSHDGTNVYKANFSWIADFIGVDEKTVSRAISELEKKDFIYRTRNNSFYGSKFYYAVNLAFVYKDLDERTKCPIEQNAQCFTEENFTQNEPVLGDFSQNNAHFEDFSEEEKNNCFTERTKCPLGQTVQNNNDTNDSTDLCNSSKETNCPTGQNVCYEADNLSGSYDKILYKNNNSNIFLSYMGVRLELSDSDRRQLENEFMSLDLFLRIHDNLSCDSLSNYSSGKFAEIDWYKVHIQIELSPQFLAKVPLSFLIDNYKKVIEGRYIDYKNLRNNKSSVKDKGGGSATEDFDSTKFKNIKYD